MANPASEAAAADHAHMTAALALARRGLGRVWPNPAVGCILVNDDRVVGRGWTQPGGRPHAETEALRRAGPAAGGATAYVTLEPCDHHGRTPPCSRALVAAGIARAVVAVEDPDPRVSGRGLDTLRQAGIAVTTGVATAEAVELNAGFFLKVRDGRPLFTLKAATTLDGRIATRRGASRWITGAEARACGHRLRAGHDAILVGIGTVRADDPDLTCRLPGLEDRSPVRVVMDGGTGLPLGARLVTTARAVPTWLVTASGGDMSALEAAGVVVLRIAAGADGRPDPRAAARALAGRGLTRVLVEGGGTIAAAWLRAGLVDRLAWFRAPKLFGDDGLAAVAGLDVDTPDLAPSFCLRESRFLGPDILETFIRDEE